jgi:hypothetical protein
VLGWAAVAALCAVATVGGYQLQETAGASLQSGIDGFAAGALLVMLVGTMIPEATEKAREHAGLAEVLGLARGGLTSATWQLRPAELRSPLTAQSPQIHCSTLLERGADPRHHGPSLSPRRPAYKRDQTPTGRRLTRKVHMRCAVVHYRVEVRWAVAAQN